MVRWVALVAQVVELKAKDNAYVIVGHMTMELNASFAITHVYHAIMELKLIVIFVQ